jgi:hypothetical protein
MRATPSSTGNWWASPTRSTAPANCRNAVCTTSTSATTAVPERERGGREEAGGPHQLGGLQAGLLHRGHDQREGFAGNGSEIAITPLTDSTHTKRYSAKLFFEKDRRRSRSCHALYIGPNHYGTLRRTEIPSSTASSTWAGASSAG